jgi:hypothetical protein
MLASVVVLSLLSLLVATEPDHSVRPVDSEAKDAGQPTHPDLPETDQGRSNGGRQRAA